MLVCWCGVLIACVENNSERETGDDGVFKKRVVVCCEG